jgi:hypothetical protein
MKIYFITITAPKEVAATKKTKKSKKNVDGAIKETKAN